MEMLVHLILQRLDNGCGMKKAKEQRRPSGQPMSITEFQNRRFRQLALRDRFAGLENKIDLSVCEPFIASFES